MASFTSLIWSDLHLGTFEGIAVASPAVPDDTLVQSVRLAVCQLYQTIPWYRAYVWPSAMYLPLR